ncbi:MAG: ATP-binding protein [Pseudodesulfovibrio sp.]
MPGISFTIPSHAEAVRWACLAVRGVLEGVRLADGDKYSVELAVSEAVTNSLLHAYGGRPGHAIGLDVIVEAGQLVIAVSDTGAALDPARIETAALPAEDLLRENTGGRGLFLIRQAMDLVTVERIDGRNVLTMTKGHGGVK